VGKVSATKTSFFLSSIYDALQQDQINRLDAINFIWAIDYLEKQWNDNFERLIGYKQEYGDCLVPQKYEDSSLGRWVSRQRTNYKHDTIREDRKRRLDELGFDWGTGRYQQKLSRDTSKRDFQWKNMYQKLVDFNQQNGHAMVPTHQKGLGHWVSKQRVLYRNGRMTDDRKELLDEIGVVWKISSPDANADPFSATMGWHVPQACRL
jgi:hypothetical protein